MSVEISGKITINGVESDFTFHSEIGSWSQWGGTTEELGARVEYLDAMERGLIEHSDYYSQSEDEDEHEHEQKFPDGSRVVWDGDGEETYGTVSGYTAEGDVYLVDFDGYRAQTPAYGHELRQA